MNLMDDFEALRTAEEKGIEKGRLEERENFALKLLQDGMNIQKLCELTGFSEEKIQSLKN
jgi:predicted transposase/invertase (TIGR01784 family)